MNFAPYQWRADKGYLPPPGSVPMPINPPVVYYPWGPQQQQQQHPVVWGHQIAVGPGEFRFVPATPPAVLAAAPSNGKSSKKSEKKKDETPKLPPAPKKEDKPSNDAKSIAHSLATARYAAPSLRPGMNYMYADAKKGHTILHVFSKAAPIWEGRYKGQNLGFKIFKVAVAMSVGTIVERVLGKEGEGCKGWGVTEVLEGGEGGWVKGTSIAYGSDKAKGTLESMGWNAKRGDSLTPVWVVVHKV